MFTKTSHSEQVIQDARKLAEDISLLARDTTRGAKANMDVAAEKATETYHQAEQAMKRKAHEMDELAHEKPWLAVGIAAAVGALIGAVLTRRK